MPQFNLFKSSEQPVAKTPACPNCGRAMRLYDISRTGTPGCKRLIFSCSECAQQRTALVEYEEVELSELNGAEIAARLAVRRHPPERVNYLAFVLRFFLAGPGAAAFLPSKFAISLLATTPVTTRPRL